MGRSKGSESAQRPGHHRHDARRNLGHHRRERQAAKQSLAVQRRRNAFRDCGQVSLPNQRVLSGSSLQDTPRKHFLSLRDWFQRQGDSPKGIHAYSGLESTLVKIEGLTKAFAGHSIFKDLSVEFPRGELSAVMGPSGCGKSTLLRCINFLEMFDSGRITIGDASVAWNAGEVAILSEEKKTALQRLRLKTGMVFQSFNMFPHLTVLENVTLAPVLVKRLEESHAVDLGRAILERVGLGDKTDRYPSTLSGGQQQRVAIARSLAMQPEVMLYDEPTSQLDPRLVDEVFQVMRELANERMTQIVVTHHEQFAREAAGRALVLAKSRT